MIELFLHDLSVPDEACALEVAAARLRGLTGTLRAVTKIDPRFVLNTARPFNELMLGGNRPLSALRNDPSVAEERTYLKTIVDRSPWTRALGLRPPDPSGGADYRIPDDAPLKVSADAVALGLAHDLAGLAISLATHDHWSRTGVEIVRISMDEREVELRERVQAPNASAPGHVEEHAELIRASGIPEIENGVELWERRGELLPHLEFVPTIQGQLQGLGHGDPNLAEATARLLELDAAIGAWRRDALPRPPYPFSVVPESRTRLQKGIVDIRDGAGVMRTFSDHARYGPDENRIHFILEEQPQRHALVGHVGRKRGIG